VCVCVRFQLATLARISCPGSCSSDGRFQRQGAEHELKVLQVHMRRQQAIPVVADAMAFIAHHSEWQPRLTCLRRANMSSRCMPAR